MAASYPPGPPSDGSSAWRVTYAGPQAFWPTGSPLEGVRLVAAIAEHIGADVFPDIDLRPNGVTVQLRDPDGADPLLAVAARRIEQLAWDLGLHPDPTRVQTIALTVARAPDVEVREFWSAVLGYRLDPRGGAYDPLRRGPYVSFQRIARAGRGRSHVDVSLPADEAERRVHAALSAGGRIANDTHAPQWWGLASPDNHGVDVVAWPDRSSAPPWSPI